MPVIECHAPGDQCLNCEHYRGTSDTCRYAQTPGEQAMSDEKLTEAVLIALRKNVFQMNIPGDPDLQPMIDGDDHSLPQLAEQVREAIHQSGLKLVDADAVMMPREPTEAMSFEGDQVLQEDMYCTATDVYRAMIQALLDEQREGE